MMGTLKIIEGSLEVKLPTIWTDEKQRWAESEKRKEERRSKRESLKPAAHGLAAYPRHL